MPQMTRTQLEWYANNMWRISLNFSIEEKIGARILAWQASGDTVEGVLTKLEEWAVERPDYKAKIDDVIQHIREGRAG